MVGAGGQALVTQRSYRAMQPAVVLMATATALSLMGDMTIYAVLPVHFGDLGLMPFEVGLLLSVNRWVRLLTNHVARRTLERTRPALPLAGALALGALLAAFYATQPRFWPFLAARMLWGLCWSFIRHTGVTLSVRTAETGKAGRILGLFNGIVQLGFITGTLAGGFFYDGLGHFRAFFLLALVSATAVPFGARGAAACPQLPVDDQRASGTGGGWRDLPLLAQGFLATAAGTGLIMSTVGYLLKTSYGDSVTVAGFAVGMVTVNALLISLRYVIDSAGSPLLGRFIDGVGHRAAAAAAFLVGALSLLAAAGLGASPAVIPLVVLFFVSTAACGLALQVAAGLRGPRSYARYASAWDLGGAVGPLLGWAGIQYTTSPGVTLVSGGALLLLGSAIAAVTARAAAAAKAAKPRT